MEHRTEGEGWYSESRLNPSPDIRLNLPSISISVCNWKVRIINHEISEEEKLKKISHMGVLCLARSGS